MAGTDQFIGEELASHENQAQTARFHVIPCGLEKSVSYGTGTHRGPEAIIAASHQLERLIDGMEPASSGIFTHKEIACSQPVEQVMDRLSHACRTAVQAGHIPVTLGGEHALSYGAVRGVMQAMGEERIGVIQIDAHADLRRNYQGNRYSHASVMNLLCEEGISLMQIGVRAISTEEVEAREHFGVSACDGFDLIRQNIQQITLPADFPRAVYISFDLDGLDPSILPATGTPVPGGLSYVQALDYVSSAVSGRQVVGLDIVELAPSDAHPASDFIAAMVCYHLMGIADASHAGYQRA